MTTLGEKRVRTSFNPSANGLVDVIKQDTARLINTLEDLRTLYNGDPEALRLISTAQTKYEEAAMWAVKAATV
jgi:hypothetical protein